LHFELPNAGKRTMKKAQKGNWRVAVWQSGAIFSLAVIIGLLTNQWRPNKLPLMADHATGNPSSLDAKDDGLRISMEEAQSLFFAQAALFLDTRSREFYELGHIQGARSLPLEDFEVQFGEVLKDIGPDMFIITYCDGNSCHSSELVALELLEKGCMNVHVLDDGWTLWQQHHLPTAVGPPLDPNDHTTTY
jgi:3-mercaptopyruvate sulfurtransferase SseA